MILARIAWPTLVVVMLAHDIVIMPTLSEAQEQPWERGGVMALTWWLFIAMAAALVVFILVLWGLLHLTPLFLALIGAVFGLRWLVGATQHRESDPALEILRERYARGELSREEFEAKRRELLRS